jgi:twitching motility protein PilT
VNPDLQWFVAGLLEEGEMTLKAVRDVISRCGEGADIGEFAQEALNDRIKNMTEQEAESVLGRFEKLMDYANTQVATGTLPSPEQLGELPGLENISSMSDQEVADLLCSLLRNVRAMGASDLHLSAGAPPFIRSNLQIELLGSRPLPPEDAMRLNTVLLSEEQMEEFNNEMDLGFALAVGQSRFRVSLMIHKEGCAGTYRLVPGEIKTLTELGFSEKNVETIGRLLDYHNGLILVTGPLGSGKTTTLASMVDILNKKRREHVITVEDPIEIVQESLNCNVTQREIGAHTKSYSNALKGALREDPDVIVIGELHDLETIEMAITASETGHLVIGTLHTCNAANTLNRLLDVFPPSQQAQIRAMTAGSLRGIVCQKLLQKKDEGMTVACEILVNTMAVSNIIDDGKTHQLKAVMQTGVNAGMCTMDSSIYGLYEKGLISANAAMANILDKNHYGKLIK